MSRRKLVAKEKRGKAKRTLTDPDSTNAIETTPRRSSRNLSRRQIVEKENEPVATQVKHIAKRGRRRKDVINEPMTAVSPSLESEDSVSEIMPTEDTTETSLAWVIEDDATSSQLPLAPSDLNDLLHDRVSSQKVNRDAHPTLKSLTNNQSIESDRSDGIKANGFGDQSDSSTALSPSAHRSFSGKDMYNLAKIQSFTDALSLHIIPRRKPGRPRKIKPPLNDEFEKQINRLLENPNPEPEESEKAILSCFFSQDDEQLEEEPKSEEENENAPREHDELSSEECVEEPPVLSSDSEDMEEMMKILCQLPGQQHESANNLSTGDKAINNDDMADDATLQDLQDLMALEELKQQTQTTIKIDEDPTKVTESGIISPLSLNSTFSPSTAVMATSVSTPSKPAPVSMPRSTLSGQKIRFVSNNATGNSTSLASSLSSNYSGYFDRLIPSKKSKKKNKHGLVSFDDDDEEKEEIEKEVDDQAKQNDSRNQESSMDSMANTSMAGDDHRESMTTSTATDTKSVIFKKEITPIVAAATTKSRRLVEVEALMKGRCFSSLPQLSAAQLRHTLNSMRTKHVEEKTRMRQAYISSFSRLYLSLQMGFHLAFHGYGSKRDLLFLFGEYCLRREETKKIHEGSQRHTNAIDLQQKVAPRSLSFQQQHEIPDNDANGENQVSHGSKEIRTKNKREHAYLLSVDGFHPAASLKRILEVISAQVLQWRDKNFKTMAEHVDAIKAYFLRLHDWEKRKKKNGTKDSESNQHQNHSTEQERFTVMKHHKRVYQKTPTNEQSQKRRRQHSSNARNPRVSYHDDTELMENQMEMDALNEEHEERQALLRRKWAANEAGEDDEKRFPFQGQLYLLIHNMDSARLRHERVQTILSILATCPHVHLIVSLDHLNAGLLWDQARSARLNFLFHDLTTFEHYDAELAYETAFMSQTGSLGVTGVQHVLSSLTPNAQGVFRVLLMHQLEIKQAGAAWPGTNTPLQWLPHHVYRERCREAFYVNSDMNFRLQLVEYVDHKMMERRRVDGVDYYHIPLDHATLQCVLEYLETSLSS